MTRFVLAACCALLSLPAWSQVVRPPSTRAKPPGGDCPARPAECQINVQVFDFGRGQMSQTSPPINGHNTVSVTCTRSPQADGRDVDVGYELKAIPPTPARQMRDSQLHFLRYDVFVDAARTRYWGDGSQSTFTFQGALFLDDRNRVGTLVHQIYGRVDGGQTPPTPPGQWLGLVVVRLDYNVNCN
jgi:spore coat protein U-like protein